MLQAALIVERILSEHDNVSSLIRIVDRLTEEIVLADPMEVETVAEGPFYPRAMLFVRFTTNGARGVRLMALSLRETLSDSEVRPALMIPMHFTDNDGVELRIVLSSPFPRPGDYTFDVALDGVTVARVPVHAVRKITLRPTT